MEKGFLIKNSDINDLMWAYKENLSELLKSFAVLRTSIQMLVGDGNFAGKGANSVKKYYLDVHGTAIELFETLAQWMLDTVLPYKVGYNMIDKKEGFILPEESMRKFKDLLQSCLSDTEDSAQIADTAIQSVSDILGLTPPSLDQIEEAHSTIDQNVESKMTEIEEYEKTTACGITKLESFLDTIRSCVAEIESGQFQIIGYSAGAFLSRPEVVQGLGVIEKRREFQRDNKELLDQIWAEEAELKRLSDERKEEGVWKTIGGVTLVVVGIVCIAASAGAATPVFIVAAAAGSGTVAFGVADSFEGAQEIYYGSVKDIETKSVNILRDSLFNGNQEAYNIVENIFAYTAAAMTPMGTMSSAGTLTLRSGATTVGKLFISDAAGYATSHYVYELTGNRTLSMISGMGGSFAAGFGLNRIDARFSISGGSIAYAEYDNIYQRSIHNAEKEKVMLGKYDGGGPTSYINRAGKDYTYFDLGNDWGSTKKEFGFTDNDMFKLFNESFLDDGINSGKTFKFSHNPIGDKGALGKEFKYLEKNNYIWDESTMTMSPW